MEFIHPASRQRVSATNMMDPPSYLATESNKEAAEEVTTGLNDTVSDGFGKPPESTAGFTVGTASAAVAGREDPNDAATGSTGNDEAVVAHDFTEASPTLVTNGPYKAASAEDTDSRTTRIRRFLSEMCSAVSL
ncbi:hypothetical protein Q8A73_001731 [Channa argus]|nr:hypothetical protein Q8A73_001731 [Channa argus]